MKLDKNHLNQFEDIAPPMKHALTLPVEGARGTVNIYVCSSTFSLTPATKHDVRTVAQRLRLLDDDMLESLRNAVDILMHAPGGHGYTIDMLEKLLEGQGPK